MIRNFKEIRVDDVEIAGGKGANLGEMTHAGIRVPEGFVVTSEAYRLFLKENGLETLFGTALKEAGGDEGKLLQCAKDFRERIRKGRLPGNVEEGIAEAYSRLGSCGSASGRETRARVAVRSSATAEDLADASFAGQQETYLNVTGLEDVLDQVKNCYASLWGDRAVIYRQNQHYDQGSVALAVVIQRMVESETAGVLFTANPLTGDRNQMQINASYGLGESVVSGRVTADSYVCSKNGRLLECKPGSKETQILYASGISGTVEVPVPEEKRTQRCLDDEMLGKLCRAGLEVEKYYQKPMDIEWGICNGEIYILQARAITTLKEKNAEEEARIEQYLAGCKCTGPQRENMVFLLEKMPFVFYPFDYELIETIDDQKSNIFAEAGILMDMQPQIDEDGVMILPPNGMKINGKLIHFPALLKELMDLEGCLKKLDSQMEEFRRELSGIKNTGYEKLTMEECAGLFPYMLDYVRRLTYCRFKYALFPSALCKGRFEKALKKIDSSLTLFDLYRNLDYETAVMSSDLEKLADLLAKQEKVRAAVSGGIGYRQLLEQFPEVTPYLEDFLQKHGYKSDFNCYCVTARAFYEDPDRILHLVRPLLEREKAENGNPGKKPEAFEELMGRLEKVTGEKKYIALRREIDIFRHMHVIREESQLMWETCFYFTKKLLKRASLLLCGHEDYMRELSWLFLPEVAGACKRGVLTEEELNKIRRRREMRPLAEKVWEGAKAKVFPNTGDTLKGISGSAGEAVGRARLIGGPEEFYKFQKGDILVCRFTDPEWTPLFSLAAAVVADTGAELSHAAIVAREYGIPAVLGVGYATANYRDGDRIRVNGTKGEVTRI